MPFNDDEFDSWGDDGFGGDSWGYGSWGYNEWNNGWGGVFNSWGLDGDEEPIDEIITTAQIIRHAPIDWSYILDSFEYVDYFSLIQLELPDFDEVGREIELMLHENCVAAQNAIDTLKNEYGVNFNFTGDAANNSALQTAIGVLAHVAVNYRDFEISNTALDPNFSVFGTYVASGSAPERSVSIADLFNDAGNVNVEISSEGSGTMRTDGSSGNTTIHVDPSFLSASSDGLTELTWTTLLHEMMHVYHVNGNVGPWDEDGDPSNFIGNTANGTPSVEHNALGALAEMLANMVSTAATAAGDDILAEGFSSLDHCDFSF